MSRKQKLEPTWIGKDERPKPGSRILLEDPAKSYHSRRRMTENDRIDNERLIADNS